MIDGYDIQQLGLNNYRKIIGCVMQDDKLFSGSIRENLCGFDDKSDNDWMEVCARASYIHDVIVNMPMGYDTLIGELGEGLSGDRNNESLLRVRCIVNPEFYLWMKRPARWTRRVRIMSIKPSKS